MSRTLLALVFAAAGLTTLVGAQDAVSTLPDSYRLQFENDWVRIVRVRYAPFAKLPGHTHTALASAYVYLNDGGPVIFKHVGKEYGAVTRPETKAGSFRLYRGLDEIHEVENTSALPTEFLRVELKTDPKDPRTLRGKFFRAAPSADLSVERIQFENDQVRITRIVCAPAGAFNVVTSAAEPSLFIALSEARLAVTHEDSGSTDVSLGIGQERWMPTTGRERLENVGSDAIELLRFDLKTRPLP